MLSHAPRFVTLDIGPGSDDQPAGMEPLCFAEQLSIVDEIVELGVEQLRLLFHDPEEIESVVRLAEYGRMRRCAVTVVLRTAVGEGLIHEISTLKPASIAVPLHSHEASLHEAVCGRWPDWRRSVELATLAGASGSPLEIESAISAQNATSLRSLFELADNLHASSWRIDFSRASLPRDAATEAANTIVDIASCGRTRITVHDLPLFRRVLGAGARRNPPSPATTAAADSMHLTWFGDVRTSETSAVIAGSVRVHTIAAIHELSPQYVALRRSATRRVSRPQQNTRPHLHV